VGVVDDDRDVGSSHHVEAPEIDETCPIAAAIAASSAPSTLRIVIAISALSTL